LRLERPVLRRLPLVRAVLRFAELRFVVLRRFAVLRFAVLRFFVPLRLAVLRFAVLRFFVPLRLAVLRFLVPLRFAVLRLAVLRLAVLRFFDELRFFAAPVFLRVAVVFFRDVPDRLAPVRPEEVERFAVDRFAPPDLLRVLELLLAINFLLFGVC
jgi:hypothetical protein